MIAVEILFPTSFDAMGLPKFYMETSLMPFQKRPTARRRVFLSLAAEIDNGLRAAYGARFEQGRTNQTRLAEKIGVHRSVIHRRLTGRMNLTLQSIADLVWGLDWGVTVRFFDPEAVSGDNTVLALASPLARAQEPPSEKPLSTLGDISAVPVDPEEKLYRVSAE